MVNSPKKSILLPSSIAVRDLAFKLNLPASRIISQLMKNGVFATINEEVDFDTAAIILEEMGFEAKEEAAEKKTEALSKESGCLLVPGGVKRPPIVTILGHVDHGKTTLLDVIRETHIAEHEAGGITQHISSYQIEVEIKGWKELITFLDTPGHEAFTALRQRGANVTDIAIIIIAADDGVMPQTNESIELVKKAGIPMIIAINKIDKPGANSAKIKQQLAELDILVEGWGGDVPVVEISAKNKIGIENLLEVILLVADMQGIKADPSIPARGIILDSRLDPQKGPLATAIILEGTLKKGDEIIAGSAHGKVKKIEDFKGTALKEAGPSFPVVILGMKEAPQAGEIITVEQKGISRSKIAELLEEKKRMRIGKLKPLSSERIFSGEKKVNEFNIVLKADVPGSLEAIIGSIKKIDAADIKVNIIKSGIGNLNQDDIQTAKSSNSMVLGFDITVNSILKKLAEREGVVIHTHNIIYELIDDLKSLISDWLGPENIRIQIGAMKTLVLFGRSKAGQIVGGKVISGKIRKGAIIEVERDKEKIAEGTAQEIRVGREIIQEAVEGSECGVKFIGNAEIKEGDILKFAIEEERKRKI